MKQIGGRKIKQKRIYIRKYVADNCRNYLRNYDTISWSKEISDNVDNFFLFQTEELVILSTNGQNTL